MIQPGAYSDQCGYRWSYRSTQFSPLRAVVFDFADIRPIALGRQNRLFVSSLRAGKRAATVISLIQSAKLNGLDPYAYLRDVLERLPMQPASQIAELLPHRRSPTT